MFNKHKIIFSNLDFVKFYKTQELNKKDFIYLDPPYYPLTATSFVEYTHESFNHKDVVDVCNELNVKFLHSNSWCDYNITNYSKFKQERILCKRKINSKNPSDTDYEIFIYN